MGIDVTVRGWDRPGWDRSFYPEDLPWDWRLSYFANAFESVLVPAQLWRGAGPQGLAQWTTDVPARFRFYLELETAPAAAAGLLTTGSMVMDKAAAASALGERFAGWVGIAPPPSSGLGIAALVAQDAEGRPMLARTAPAQILADAQAGLAWLKSLAAEAASSHALAVLDQASAQDLRRWQLLVHLAGLA